MRCSFPTAAPRRTRCVQVELPLEVVGKRGCNVWSLEPVYDSGNPLESSGLCHFQCVFLHLGMRK